MKKTKLTLITTFMIFAGIIGHAQVTQKDSINIVIPEQMNIKISIYSYDELAKTVEEDLKELQEILKLNKDIPQNSDYTITFEPHKKLSINITESIEKVIWANGKNIPYQFGNRCEIKTNKYIIFIDFNDLDELLSENLISKVNESIQVTIENENRYARLFNYNFEKDNTRKDEFVGLGYSGDVLYLQAGVGANLIKNQPVIDFIGELGFGFHQKGILKNKYYINYSMLYDFMDNSDVNINGFLGVGYKRNFSNDKDDPTWIGFELGYLVSQQGEMFDDDTFRLGFNWQAGSFVTISPQWYISKDQNYPGLRVSFGF